ncbi:MAG: hypothetical protein WC282_04785 [Bacilli bacterium]|jgi:hypothetical protein
MKKSNRQILKDIKREGHIMTPNVLGNVYKAIGVEPSLLSAKEKVIEKRLQQEGDAFVPNNPAAIYAVTNSKPKNSLVTLFQKPRFVAIMATSFLAITLSITLVTLGINGFFTTTDSTDTSGTQIPSPIETNKEAFSVGVLAANVVVDFNTTPESGPSPRFLLDKPKDGEVAIEEVSSYLEMIEQLLTSDEGVSVISETSDRPEYDYKDTIEAYDALNVSNQYIIYYNVTEVDEDMNSYRFAGIMIFENKENEYALEGRKFQEDDELKYTLKVSYSEGNYVIIEYKEEENETKYRLKVYENGEVVSESSIKLEVEEDKIKLTLEFGDGDNSSRYTIKTTAEEAAKMEIKYQIKRKGEPTKNGKILVKIVLNDLTGEYEYVLTVKPDGGDEEEYHEGRGHDGDGH